MREGHVGCRSGWVAGLAACAMLWMAGSAWGQNNNNNGGGGNINTVLGQLPAGVVVSPDGVLRVKQFTDPTGQLTRTRIAEARVRLGGGVAKVSELRKVSLNRLEAALAAQLAAGKEPTDEMKYLAGLTRVQYVFYYPDTRDIVLAGPAEGFFPDPSGRVLGMNSGRAVVELQDLVAALRAFPPESKAAHTIMVSIDPTQEGLARMAKWLSSIRPGPGDAAAIVDGLKQQL